MTFVGIDWAEQHHDRCLLDTEGRILAQRQNPDGLEGVALLHGLLAEHTERPAEAVVGIETDRGLLVSALLAAGYQVYTLGSVTPGGHHGLRAGWLEGPSRARLGSMVKREHACEGPRLPTWSVTVSTW